MDISEVFLDTNILLRHLLDDHPDQSPRATAFLSRVEDGEIQAHLADTVIFETVFTLERSYHQPKEQIATALLSLIELQGITLLGKRRFRRAFDVYVQDNLPFGDAYHVAVMESLRLTRIVSFDKHYDRVPGVERIEP